MPELPELEFMRRELISRIKGRKIRQFKVLKPYVFRNVFGGDLSGEEVENITRKGKYLVIDTDLHSIYIHLMLRGSVHYVKSAEAVGRSAAVVLKFTNGTCLQFMEKGHKKRMAFYILPRGVRPDGIAKLGIDPLAREFTVKKLVELLAVDSMQLKSFLCDQRKISGIGNAYADEISWRAGMSPFKLTTALTDEETLNLHRSIVSVISWAIENVGGTGTFEKRDFLNIHGKKGSHCPRCGDVIRTVSFSNKDTFYCPTCQTGGRILKDRRMSKFYR